MDAFIDVHNFFIIKVTGYFRTDNKMLDLSVEFSDFKKVGDSIFPFRITNYAAGRKIAQTVISKYFINPYVADDFFGSTNIQSL